MITTVSTSQAEILRNIAKLYNHSEPFQVDLTWGKGGFWRGDAAILTPRIRVDLSPDHYLVNLVGDIRQLPFRDASLESVIVDLPFVHAHGKASVIGKRFSSYPNQRALDDLHHQTAGELSRALAPGGIVVWKCQDIIESSKQVWNHLRIYEHAAIAGLRAQDLFVLVRPNAIIGWNQHTQFHARRTHSYFWVFIKEEVRK